MTKRVFADDYLMLIPLFHLTFRAKLKTAIKLIYGFTFMSIKANYRAFRAE